MIQQIWERITWRWFKAADVDVGVIEDYGYIIVHSKGRFRPTVEIEMPRTELDLVAEMIHDLSDYRVHSSRQVRGQTSRQETYRIGAAKAKESLRRAREARNE